MGFSLALSPVQFPPEKPHELLQASAHNSFLACHFGSTSSLASFVCSSSPAAACPRQVAKERRAEQAGHLLTSGSVHLGSWKDASLPQGGGGKGEAVGATPAPLGHAAHPCHPCTTAPHTAAPLQVGHWGWAALQPPGGCASLCCHHQIFLSAAMAPPTLPRGWGWIEISNLNSSSVNVLLVFGPKC